jgi:hypothetical protein
VAHTCLDVGPTPYYTEIFDATTGTLLRACGSGTSCTTAVTKPVATTHRYAAFVSLHGSSYHPPGVQATSRSVYVTWARSGWRLSLVAKPAYTLGTTAVTATANHDVGPTPYYIEIFNENGTWLKECPSGSTCQTIYAPSLAGDHLVAFVSKAGTTLLPPSIQASSNVVDVKRVALNFL